MKSRFHRKLYTGIAALLIFLVYMQIFRLSGMPAEISEMQSMSVAERIIKILEAVLPFSLPLHDFAGQMDILDGLVRKAAHFSEYALLGVLTYSIAICWNRNQRKGMVGSFLFVVVLAAADELHQYFVPGRSCSLRDVCIDSAGCIVGMLVLKILYGRYIRHRLKAGRTS